MTLTATHKTTLGATLALSVLVAVGLLSANQLGGLAAALAILSSGLVALVIHREMTGRRRAEAELRRTHEELEERVILRTAQINTVNVALQAEVLERQQIEGKLRQAHDELEFRVAERTRELAGANQVLQREIDERRRIADALKNSRTLYHSLVENLPVHVWRTDRQGRFTFGNEHLCDFLGVTQEDFLGHSAADFFTRIVAENFAGNDRHVLETGDPFEDIEVYETLSGRRGYQQTLKSAFHDAQGRVLGVQSISWDVTERQRAEEKMRRIQAEQRRTNRDLLSKNQEIQNFYHTLSHELKTPLTSAREFVAIILDGLAGDTNPTQREYLHIVLESCNQLRVCINDLLDATRLETGKLSIELKPAALDELLERAVTTLQSRAAGKDLALHCDCAPGLPEILIDEHRITQVITNLLNNAVKFTRTGGSITVSAGVVGDVVEVSVRDTGSGIPADQIEHIFDRLYQVKNGDATTEQGVGLGLYICRELVRLHGGDIRVASAPGRGSTFTFTLPLQPVPARSLSPIEATHRPSAALEALEVATLDS